MADVPFLSFGRQRGLLSALVPTAPAGTERLEALDGRGGADALLARYPDGLSGGALLLALQPDQWGVDPNGMELLRELDRRAPDFWAGGVLGFFIFTPGIHFTKSHISRLIFLLNTRGAAFPGHPVVEAIGGLRNLLTWQGSLGLPLEEILRSQLDRLVSRLGQVTQRTGPAEPRSLLAIHASDPARSNTYALWCLVRRQLDEASQPLEVVELDFSGQYIDDCSACTFEQCLAWGRRGGCLHHDRLTERLYPALSRATDVVWLAPNYNDGPSGRLSSIVNRLSAPYRQKPFYDKRTFSVVVSGNSGCDSVHSQLLGALTVNKGFFLPPRATLSAIANEPGAVMTYQDIEEKAGAFARALSDAKSWREPGA